jgi:hypothetical protein
LLTVLPVLFKFFGATIDPLFASGEHPVDQTRQVRRDHFNGFARSQPGAEVSVAAPR